jgi:hypothetical protein
MIPQSHCKDGREYLNKRKVAWLLEISGNRFPQKRGEQLGAHESERTQDRSARRSRQPTKEAELCVDKPDGEVGSVQRQGSPRRHPYRLVESASDEPPQLKQ